MANTAPALPPALMAEQHTQQLRGSSYPTEHKSQHKYLKRPFLSALKSTEIPTCLLDQTVALSHLHRPQHFQILGSGRQLQILLNLIQLEQPSSRLGRKTAL